MGGIVHFQNLDTQAPQVGPSLLGVENERPAIAQPQQGIEHSASSRNSQMFTPVPIAPFNFLLNDDSSSLEVSCALVYQGRHPSKLVFFATVAPLVFGTTLY